MSADSVALAGRDAAEALMVDACTVTGVGPFVWDEPNGQYVPGLPVAVYTGACQVQLANVQEANPVTDVEYTVQAAIVKLPVVGSELVEVGHTVTVTACVLDTALVGRVYKVVAFHAKSYATSRRLRCEEVL